MADIIRAITEAIDKIGLVAVLIVVILGAAIYVVVWNKKLVEMLQRFSGETIRTNTDAMHTNTAAIDKLSGSVDLLAERQQETCKAADHTKICDAAKMVDELTHVSAEMIRATQAAEKKLLDTAEQVEKRLADERKCPRSKGRPDA